MKKVILAFVAIAFVAPMFMGCADEKCAKDDAKCIADCKAECVKDECGEADIANTTLSDGIDYGACVAKLGVNGKCTTESCTE